MARSLNLSEAFLGCTPGSPLQRLVIQPPNLDGPPMKRTRLTALIGEILSSRRILYLVAPAGYGKTTLLAEYAKEALQVAWVNCQRIDGDVISFWLHVATSLRLGASLPMKHCQELQESDGEIGIVQLLDAIASDIADEKAPVTIILNGFHAIENKEIKDSISLFLEVLDPIAKMIIADRSAGHLPDVALTQKNSLFILDKADLALTRQEADAYLEYLGYKTLGDEQRKALYQRSEGWIWGLQLAASANNATAMVAGDDAVIQPGSDFLGEQLVSEILSPFSQEMKDFAIGTSYLRKLYPELCATVMNVTTAEAEVYLEAFIQQNLFVILQEDGTLRYHRLFAEALQELARLNMDGDLYEALGRGVSWLETHGLIFEAAQLLLDAGLPDKCARFMSSHYGDFLKRGDIAATLSLIEKIPESTYSMDTRLLTLKAWILSFSKRKSASEHLLKRIERIAETEDRVDEVREDVLCVRLMLALSKNDSEELFNILEPVLDDTAFADSFRRGIVSVAQGVALALSGNLIDSQNMLKDAIRLDAGMLVHLLARIYLGQAYFRLGNFYDAEQILCEAVDLSQGLEGSWSFAVVVAYMGLSCIRYEYNDLEGAELYAKRCLEAGQFWWMPEAMANSHNILGHVLAARGYLEEALEEFDKGATLESQKFFHPFVSHFSLRYLRILTSSGLLKDPVEWADSQYHALSDKNGVPRDRNSFHIIKTVAYMQFAQGNYKRAVEIVDRLLSLKDTSERKNEYVCLLVTKALSLSELHDMTGADVAIREALEIGRDKGYRRLFIDEGESMYRLLDRIYTPRVNDPYLRDLMVQIREAPTLDTPKRAKSSLSKREIDILRLASKGYYSKEIARELGISIETVKTHLKNIYAKLNTQNRMEAVNKAMQFGLL